MSKMRVKTNIFELMKTSSQEMKSPGISMGFVVAGNSLKAIAERAIKIDDPILLIELETLGILSFPSPEERKECLEKARAINPEIYDFE